MTEQLKAQPYVGVSGVASYSEHVAISDEAAQLNVGADDHFVMIGVQATSKTQLVGIEDKQGRLWHPVGDEISCAAGDDEKGPTKPFIHCSFESYADLQDGVPLVMRRTLHYARGIQLNGIKWMDADYKVYLQSLRRELPRMDIVLQASTDTMREHSPLEVARQLGRLPVDYVLFNASHSLTEKLDPKSIRPYVDAVYQTRTSTGVVIAGGLEAANIDQLFGPLVQEFPNLSCDAESRLRQGPESHTELSLTKVRNYMRAWKTIVGERSSDASSFRAI